MKLEKFVSKLEKLFDDNVSAEHFYFYNDANDLYFCIDPYAVYMLPGHQGLTCKPDTMPIKRLKTAFNETVNNGKLAKVTKGRDYLNRCVLKFETETETAYAQEKFFRMFPANTLFYVSGKYSPILCVIEDNKRFTPVAAILPLRMWDYQFVKAETIYPLFDGLVKIEINGNIYEFIGHNGKKLVFQDVNSVDNFVELKTEDLISGLWSGTYQVLDR